MVANKQIIIITTMAEKRRSMCITLRICCLLVMQVISKIIDSTYQERMKYLFKGQKN